MEKSIQHQAAANERWHPTIPKATHTGILIIAGKELACDVLEDGRRIIRQKNFIKTMGRGKIGGRDRKGAISANLPVFLKANNLTPYLEDDFLKRGEVVFYKSLDNRKLVGYEASFLPKVCKVYAKADDDNMLTKQQKPIADVCRSILYSLATVGITALIDECTGFQCVRERNELQKILEKYISEELRQWTKKFPDEFFKQVYRIHGWSYPKIGNHSQYLGKFINKYIYESLPQGVVDELKNKNPPNENGNRRYRHHQFLTEDIGEDNLKKQIVQVITLMKVSDDINDFKKLVCKI